MKLLLDIFGYLKLFHLILLLAIISYYRLFHLKLFLYIVDYLTLDIFGNSKQL